MHRYPDTAPGALRTAMRNAAGALALLVAPLAVLGIWAQMVLLDASAFADLADSALQEGEVQAALSEQISARLGEASPLLASPEVGSTLETTIPRIIRQEAFRRVFRLAVEALHRDITGGEDKLELEVVGEVTEMLRRELGEPWAGYVPAPAEVAPVTVAGTEDYRMLRTAARTADVTSLAALAGAAMAAFAVFALARSRAHAGVYVGMAGAFGALGLNVVLLAVRSLGPSGVNGEPQRSIYTVFAGSIASTALVVAVVSGAIGLLCAIAALALSRSSEPRADWR